MAQLKPWMWLLVIGVIGVQICPGLECHRGQHLISLKSLFIDSSVPDPWLVDRPKIFFLETSSRNVLDKRQICAIESAAKTHSHLRANFSVVVVLLSKDFNASANNATQMLLSSYPEDYLLLRTTTLKEAFLDLPLDRKFIYEMMDGNPNRVSHTSDALRLALIYKFGGWYADLDTLIMKPLTDLQQEVIVSSDLLLQHFPQTKHRDAEKGPIVLGEKLANGIFKAGRSQSPFIKTAMDFVVTSYRPNVWTSAGGLPLTMALKVICGLRPSDNRPITVGGRFSESNCQQVYVAHPKFLFPFHWVQQSWLYNNDFTDDEWISMLKEAYSLDFYRTSGENSNVKIRKKQFYGKKVPAYTALGPIYCPLAFDSENIF